MRKQLRAIGLGLGLAGAAWGHLDSLRFDGNVVVRKLNSTTWTTTGGQTFNFDQQVTINWKVNIAHAGAITHVRFSSDGGASFAPETSITAASTTGIKTYLWTVPSTATTQAKVRIYQAASPNPENNFNDDYNMVTANFTVQSGSPILSFGDRGKFLMRQSSEAIVLNFMGIGPHSALAEIRGFDGTVMRVFKITNGSEQSVLSTASLPAGKAVFRLAVDGNAPYSRVLTLTR